MRKLFVRLAVSKNGATAIEYGLIAGLVALAIVSIVTTTGTDLTTLFTNVNTKLVAAAG
jgi:pilus assembly protein Flp/PilA